MGVSLSTVNRAHMTYDHGGIEALKPRPSGGRKRENMALEEEEALLARFAKAAGAAEMLNIHDLKAAYEKDIGHETSKSTIYNLLARHGWRKLTPRSFHPRRNIAAQNAFKKWLSKCCEESQAGSGANFRNQCNETIGNITRFMRREQHSRFQTPCCFGFEAFRV